jgi:hypothetical protein
MVGGGAQHPPEVGRLLAYAATGSAEGVVGVSDCKVTALSTPGTSIQVAPGGAVMLNRSAGGGQQTYMGRCVSTDTVPVTATGGSSRSDLVVVRVEDPQYPPWPVPADPTVGPYIKTAIITGVSSTTKTAAQLNLGYPAIALARLTIPANTGTITQSMITDLRSVARPRRERYVRTTALVTGQTDPLADTTTDGEIWPDAAKNWTVDIPSWATSARVIGMFGGVLAKPSSNAYGTVWARIGGTQGFVDTQGVGYDASAVPNNSRQALVIADDVVVPASIRGTTQAAYLRGRLATGVPAGQGLVLDQYSSISLDIEFVERADLA